MGIDTRLEIMVPFGNTCTYYEKPKRKGQVVHRRGRITGYGVDSRGYVAVLEETKGQIRADSEILCGTNITPDRANKAWTSDGTGGSISSPPPAPRESHIPFPTIAECREAESRPPPPALPPRRQTVGTAPGACGSRFSLRSPNESF